MSPGRSKPGSRGAKKTKRVEWIGGSLLLPATIAGESHRPEVLMWMGPDGQILGSTLAMPGEALAMASESLQSTIEQPIYGPPHRPTRVRVASAELADALRAGHPGLDVVCAPTPELDEVLAHMRETMAAHDPTAHSYLSPEVSSEAMAAFFKAAAGLFRAKPWEVVPNDQSLFSLTIESLGVHDAVVSVVGQMGQAFGLVLLSRLKDFETYLDAVEAIEHGEEPDLPPHLVLTFEPSAELVPELCEEILEHQWEVAGDEAYPWLIAVGEEGVDRPLTGKDVTIAQALASALTSMVIEDEALWDAWDGGAPVSRTVSVPTPAGEIEATLRAPLMRAPIEFDPSHDILADLAALSQDDDEIDFDARMALEDELAARFLASPEGKDLDGDYACRFVMDLGADYIGRTIATLDAGDLREVLFELVPRKVSIEAFEAHRIVEEVRAFYTFLKREFGLTQADACLEVLGGDAADKLQAALSDSSKFGMAKSMVMAGADAGFDMQSKEGIESWMRLMEGGPLPPSIPLAGPPPPPKKATQAKKDKRKAARKARKKNR